MTATLSLGLSITLLAFWAGWYLIRMGKKLNKSDHSEDQIEKMVERDKLWEEVEREKADMQIDSVDDVDRVFDELRKRRAKDD